jgi:hypothetical protein
VVFVEHRFPQIHGCTAPSAAYMGRTFRRPAWRQRRRHAKCGSSLALQLRYLPLQRPVQ